MPVIPHALPVLSRQTAEPIDQPGLGWQTILSFTSVLFAGMQGMLAMESADPCRNSFVKVLLLLGLELLELVVVLAAEIFSFLELRAALSLRLQWLHWLPYCLLVYGVVGVAMDVFYTVYLAHRSRVRWIPFSDSQKYENVYTCAVAVLHLVLTTALSIVLVGWRQRWWMKTPAAVSEQAAVDAARAETSLSIAVMAFCLAWALLLVLVSAVLFLFFRDQLRDVASELKIIRGGWITSMKTTLKNRRAARRNQLSATVGDGGDDPDGDKDDEDDDNEHDEQLRAHHHRLQCACTRSDVKVVGRNPLKFLERILYPNKYQSGFRRKSSADPADPELQALKLKSIKNRCRLLMLLKKDNCIRRKRSRNGSSYFRVEVLPEPQSHVDDHADTVATEDDLNEQYDVLRLLHLMIDDTEKDNEAEEEQNIDNGEHAEEQQIAKNEGGQTAVGNEEEQAIAANGKGQQIVENDEEQKITSNGEEQREEAKVISRELWTSLEKFRNVLEELEKKDIEFEARRENISVFSNVQSCVELIGNCKDLDKVVEIYVEQSPLHVRNAIIPDTNDKESRERGHGDGKSAAVHIFLLIALHISLLPLLISVVLAVTRLWDKLDSETFRVLKELTDTIIVISVVEIALNLKQILWGRDAGHDADILDFERSDMEKSEGGPISRFWHRCKGMACHH